MNAHGRSSLEVVLQSKTSRDHRSFPPLRFRRRCRSTSSQTALSHFCFQAARGGSDPAGSANRRNTIHGRDEVEADAAVRPSTSGRFRHPALSRGRGHGSGCPKSATTKRKWWACCPPCCPLDRTHSCLSTARARFAGTTRMGRLGLEPRTLGLKVALGVSAHLTMSPFYRQFW
jgi:hypothetical protein